MPTATGRLRHPLRSQTVPTSLPSVHQTVRAAAACRTVGRLLSIRLSRRPVVTEVTDDSGSIKGLIGNNGVTDDATPTLTGTGEAGSYISISDNGILIGMVRWMTMATGHLHRTHRLATVFTI